jgi:condensin complex subunit 1
VELVSSALPVICKLLRSRQVTDVIEAIEFFTSAFQFGMAGAIVGVQQMLVLMWSRDQVVRDAVAVAYKKLYLATESATSRYVYNLNLCTDRFLSVKLTVS